MANLGQRILEILLRSKADNKGFKDSEQGAKGLGSALGGIKSLIGGLGLAIGAREAFQFAKAAEEAARQGKDNFNALKQVTGGAREAAAAIEEAKDATRGMVDEASLASQVFLLLDKNIAGNSTEAAKLANASAVLVERYKDMGASTELFNRLLDSGNKILLDNFGLTSSQVDALQKQIQATQGLSAEEAKLQAVKQLVIDKAEQLEGTLSDGTVAAAQSKAAFEDMVGTLGELLTPAFEGGREAAAGFFQAVTAQAKAAVEARDSLTDQRNTLIATANSYEDYQQRLVEVAGGNLELTLALGLTKEQFLEQRKAAEEAAAALNPLTVEAELQAKAQERLAEVTAKAAEAQSKQARDAETQRLSGQAERFGAQVLSPEEAEAARARTELAGQLLEEAQAQGRIVDEGLLNEIQNKIAEVEARQKALEDLRAGGTGEAFAGPNILADVQKQFAQEQLQKQFLGQLSEGAQPLNINITVESVLDGQKVSESVARRVGQDSRGLRAAGGFNNF